MLTFVTSWLILIVMKNLNCPFYGHFITVDFKPLHVIIEKWSVLRSIFLFFYCKSFWLMSHCHSFSVTQYWQYFHIENELILWLLRTMWSVVRSVVTCCYFCSLSAKVWIHLVKIAKDSEYCVLKYCPLFVFYKDSCSFTLSEYSVSCRNLQVVVVMYHHVSLEFATFMCLIE